eukprot:5684963-Pyramimonas_sp.AAC.1
MQCRDGRGAPLGPYVAAHSGQLSPRPHRGGGHGLRRLGFGGGACASTSLRGEAASALKSVGQVADHFGVGARLPNVPVDPRRPWAASN